MTPLTTNPCRTLAPPSLAGLSLLFLAACEPALLAGHEDSAPVDPASETSGADLDEDTVATGRSSGGKRMPTFDRPTIRTPWKLNLPATPQDEPVDSSAPVRFVALGDAGEGNDAQYAVGDAIEQVCAQRGCEFAVYLGDNFYDNGVESIDDDEFQTKFEMPYANLGFPFFVANGNHDVDGGSAEWKTELYVQYTDLSDKWTMPAPYYSLTWGNLEFFSLHTTPLTGWDQAQSDWLLGALEASTAEYKIVFGHHPFRSNGAHGNADAPLEQMFDDVVCGRADVYLAGHDHDMQWLEPVCGMELIISGAGSKLRDMGRHVNPSFFSADYVEGFMWIEIDGGELRGTFFDRYGNELFHRTAAL